MTLAQLIETLGGKLVHGNAQTEIHAVNAVAQAGPGNLVFAEDAATVSAALKTAASAVVVKPGLFRPARNAPPQLLKTIIHASGLPEPPNCSSRRSPSKAFILRQSSARTSS